MAITIGTDPEAFVVREDGTVDIAVGKIGGDKLVPLPVNGGAVQEDNVLAEFNIHPSSTEEQFVTTINTVIQEMEQLLCFHGLSVLFKPSHWFQKEDLAAGGYQAVQFGCDPDYNAYTGEVNPKPNTETTLRTAGGHVHIGYNNPDEQTNRELVIACDLLLGIPSVLLDGDTERRAQYGKAGAFRHQPHGVEYRTLSNFWLASDDLKRWVFKQAALAAEDRKSLIALVESIGGAEVQRIINESDTEAAGRIVAEYGIQMPGV